MAGLGDTYFGNELGPELYLCLGNEFAPLVDGVELTVLVASIKYGIHCKES